MTLEQVKASIKERGYWEIQISPISFVSTLIPTRTECKEILSKNAVKLRGWGYPYIPKQGGENQAFYVDNDYCEGYVDWEHHKEAFRFYQSGQFIHYLAFREDWFRESNLIGGELKNIQSGSILSIVGTVYTITEIYEFIRRLASYSRIFDNGVRIEISLIRVNNRKLEILDSWRAPLLGNYVSHVFKIRKAYEVTRDEILDRSKELSLELMHYMFETFGWDNQPIDVFRKDQQNLLEGKL